MRRKSQETRTSRSIESAISQTLKVNYVRYSYREQTSSGTFSLTKALSGILV